MLRRMAAGIGWMASAAAVSAFGLNVSCHFGMSRHSKAAREYSSPSVKIPRDLCV